MKTYQGLPSVIPHPFLTRPHFGLSCLYMPIKMKDFNEVVVPDLFRFLNPMIKLCISNEPIGGQYVYLSYECSWVRKGVPQKRPGIHADGFMTEDVNYIWSDKDPTIFYKTKFEVVDDHRISMEQFEAQAKPEDEYVFPIGSLLRLTEQHVHRAATPKYPGVRQFFKLSISKEKYNLKGNSHNPLFDYDWAMHDRSAVRNHPIFKEADSVPDQWETM